MLSIERFLNCKNPQLLVPQTSTVSVSIDREQVEQIRKDKGITIRVLEKKINLSKSRYYRWLQYQVDLPMELIVSLKKILNLTDWEMMQLISVSTDEQIQILSLMIHLSKSSLAEEKNLFVELKKKLEKYRVSKVANIPYQLILYYTDFCLADDKAQKLRHLSHLESYFSGNDYLTVFDIFLYLTLLNDMLENGMTQSILMSEVFFLEKELLRKLSVNRLGEWSPIFIGCVLDLAIIYNKKEQRELAFLLINQTIDRLEESNQLDTYNHELLHFMRDFFSQSREETVKKKKDCFKEKFRTSLWCMPESEIIFFNQLLS
ncbi:helix-turn-helix domain-containing protein [Enterococcus sp. LJL98]